MDCCNECSLLWKVAIAGLLETVADLLEAGATEAAGHPGWLMDGGLSHLEDAVDVLDQHDLVEHHPNMAWFKIKRPELKGMQDGK